MNEFARPGMDDPMAQAGNDQSGEKRKPSNVEVVRDKYLASATELQRGVAEVQGARYENALLQIMERSGDDTGLVNAMNEFTIALDRRVNFGSPDQLLHPRQIEDLTEYFQKITTELHPRH